MGTHQTNYSYSQEQINQWIAWDREYVWHPFTQMRDYVREEPLIFSHGKGAYLYDISGKQYFDGNSSLWVNLHGHAHPHMNQALQQQMEKIAHSTMLGPGSIPSIELAKRLIDIAPKGLTKVFYSDSGATAVEIALKMAFQYWQQTQPRHPEKMKFLTFQEAYHGDTIGSVSLGGIDLFHGIFGPLLFHRYEVPYPVYSKYTSPESPAEIAQKSLDSCEKMFREHGEEMAAVIIEPLIQGAAGIRTAAPGFLKSLRDLCNQYNVLLICDEVFVAFGRTGTMFACEHENVTPDLLALAKGISGGYLPLAATLSTQKVYDAFLGEYSEFKTFFHGHSYTGNQLACAAGLASLEIFDKEDTLNRIKPVMAQMEKRLDQLFESYDLVGDIHQWGMSAGIDLVRSRKTSETFATEERMGARICLELRKYGIWLRPLGDTLVLIPPLITTVDEINMVVDAIEDCLKRLSTGWMP